MLQKITKTGTTEWWRPFKNNASNPKGLKSLMLLFLFLGSIMCLSGCKKEDKKDGGMSIKTQNREFIRQ